MPGPRPFLVGTRTVEVRGEDGVRLSGIVVPAVPPGPAATAGAVPGSGHAESGATAPLVERIGRWASETIGP